MEEIVLNEDNLDRGRYARSLYRIIGEYKFTPAEKHINKPITNSDNEAFVVAISAPWGTGKTFFMNLFKDVLKHEDTVFIKGSELFDKDISFGKDNVLCYDAWKNDFWDNAFEPLFDTFINSELIASISDYKDKSAASRSLTAAGDSIITVFKTLGAFNGMSKAIAEVLTALKDSGNDWSQIFSDDLVKNTFPDYGVFRNAVSKLKEELENTVSKVGKIAIIIDELDRCKPSFAIQTLEMVKHLFNVPGLVFIFSLDINQLQHSVKSVYGNDFDAIGYLERFFDYTSLLPQGNQKQLFFATIKEFGIQDESLSNLNVYFEICKLFELSIREIRAVCSSFYYLKKYELSEYPDHAKQLYFYLVALKYKEPSKVFKALSVAAQTNVSRELLINQYPPILSPRPNMKDILKEILIANPKIKEYKNYYLTSIIDGNFNEADTYRIVGDTDPFAKSNITGETVNLSLSSLSYVIYSPDLKNREIYDLRLLEYMYRKVELYDTII